MYLYNLKNKMYLYGLKNNNMNTHDPTPQVKLQNITNILKVPSVPREERGGIQSKIKMMLWLEVVGTS